MTYDDADRLAPGDRFAMGSRGYLVTNVTREVGRDILTDSWVVITKIMCDSVSQPFIRRTFFVIFGQKDRKPK